MVNDNKLDRVLCAYLGARKIGQDAFASEIGVSTKTLYNIRKGGGMSFDTAHNIARKLGITLDALYKLTR